MPPLTPNELRKAWISFFVSKGHTAYPSASLVPANDPTLLFTGAGMNQFKDMFLGKGTHPFRRAATVQKCLRAGDIDNVGKTLRHFTFFEMLGNFSFDDYFKPEAIAWAVEFSFGELQIPESRVIVTIHETDEESFAEWRRNGVPAERILRFSARDNYWPANAPEDGPDGPCGPCTEMYFDATPELPLPAQGVTELDSERFLEFWNLVFPQFNRQGVKHLVPLGRRNVDTGAGLERILSVLDCVGGRSDVAAPFLCASILPVLQRTAELVGPANVASPAGAARARRIADHARAASFCIADGVKPSNEGRGYVLRRIMRRAIRDGILLQVDEPFLHELVPAVAKAMGDGYPEIARGVKDIAAVVRGEEEQFRATYVRGLKYLEQEIDRLGAATTVPGSVAFRLYDTYGFPLDLAEQILAERGLSADRKEFDKELEAQRERARAASKMGGDVFATGPLGEIKAKGAKPTAFVGYWDGSKDGYESPAVVVGIVRDGKAVESAGPGDEVSVVLDRTPFYAEGGGQVGDPGALETTGGSGARVVVRDTKASEGLSLHLGVVESGAIRVGDAVTARVDRSKRDATRRNHTATHLLHEALKRVLGHHVQQQGSLVAPDRLRFDFSHPKPVTPEEVRAIEDLVNGWVVDNADVSTDLMETEAAKASGAVALFGENYGDRVRVVAVPHVSRELCGGTHVRRAGDIGSFRVTAEGSVASGVRRVEAVTGLGAVAAAAADRDRLRDLSAMLKAPPDQIAARVLALQEELKEHRRAQEKAAQEAGAKTGERLASQAMAIHGVRVLVSEAKGVDAKGLRGLWDAVARSGVQVAFLVGEGGDKAPMIAASGVAAVRADDLLKTASAVLGGGGGGRPDLAQGQGADRSKIPAALAAVRSRLESVLSA